MTSNLTRRRLLALGGATIASFDGFSPALALGADPLVTIEGRAFGSGWAVTLPAGSDTETLRPALDEMLAGMDRMLSPWRLDSEITAFNFAPAGTRAVSAETALVARAALDIAELSGGWFDPSVGPLVARWGFGPIDGAPGETTNWTQMAASPAALSKAEEGLTLDLCGIAKGRALDRVADIVAAAGYQDFVLDLGGELLGRGRHPDGRPWQVAIEDPRPGIVGTAGVLRLDNLAVATSGLRSQSYQIGARTYSHIIDPRQGVPVQSATASVTVLAPDGMSADAWATALTAAGADGPALAQREAIDALFLMQHPGGLRRVTTGDFDRYLL